MTALRCLVMGGSGAVGSEILRALARDGAVVAFTYFSQKEKAEGLARELSIHTVLSCDLNSWANVQDTVNKASTALHGLDVLIIASGCTSSDLLSQNSIESIDESSFDRIMSVNTRGVFAACQASIPFFKESGGGNIILVGGLPGYKLIPSPIHLATSKAGLRGMAESMAKDLGKYDIRVNVIAPGLLDDGAGKSVSKELRDEYKKHSALKRFGKPMEIAEVATWFAFNNTYITGHSIILDGGL